MPTATSPTTTGPARGRTSDTAAYCRHVRRQKAYGRWEPFVDAEPVRAHVLGLMAFGMGRMRVAVVSGVHHATLEHLVYGRPWRGEAPSKRIRPEIAAKLLAVRPDPALLAGGVEVNGAGTNRRLQALVAAGWPQARLAGRLGMGPANFRVTMRSAQVKVSTERAVRELYDELWNVDPLGQGVARRYYEQARRMAYESRWAPPAAWDDDTIDDPDAFPDWTGACGTPKGYRAHTAYRIPMCTPCREAGAAARREHPRATTKSTNGA